MDEVSDFVTYAQKQLHKRDTARKLRQVGAPDLIQTDQSQIDPDSRNSYVICMIGIGMRRVSVVIWLKLRFF